jgi:hypothetical protein
MIELRYFGLPLEERRIRVLRRLGFVEQFVHVVLCSAASRKCKPGYYGPGLIIANRGSGELN